MNMGEKESCCGTDLMIGEDQTICQYDILASASGEDHNLGDVVGRQRFDTFVHGIGLGLVAVEAHDGEFLRGRVSVSFHLSHRSYGTVAHVSSEQQRMVAVLQFKRMNGRERKKYGRPYRLNLARIDFNDPDSCSDQLPSQGIRERPDRTLRRTIDTATGIAFTAGNAANHDDIAAAPLLAVALVLEDGQHSLGHVDQARDVGREHNLHVLSLDVWRLVHTLDQPRVVHQDVDILELGGERGDQGRNLLRVGDVELDGQHLDTRAHFFLDLTSHLLQGVDAAGRQDDLEVVRARAGELLGDTAPDAT